MKSVMIIFNQANTERVEYMLDMLEMNSCVITIVPDDKAPALLEAVKKLDKRNEEVGVRAFMWNIEATV